VGIPDAIEHGIFDWIKKGIWAEWLKLLFLLIFSGVVSYLVVDGGALVKGTPELIARGYGYLAAAGALTLCFKINGAKLFKDMPAIMPNQEAIAQLETEFQKVQPDKEKKS
jgi:hypothetical protein